MNQFTLETAIITHFSQTYGGSNHAFYTAVSGKLYYAGSVPDDTAMPYATFFVPTDDIEREFDQGERVELVIQFDLYSDNRSRSVIGNMYDKLVDLFDYCEADKGNWSAFTMSGYSITSMARTNKIGFAYDPIGKEHRISTDFVLKMYKTS